MDTREDILATIRQIMLDMFEIESGRITLDARLYEDLDFDSIDAVDMIVKLKEITGREVKGEDFKNALTIGDVVEAVFKIMRA